jgi:DNA-binding NtrC family response regulator
MARVLLVEDHEQIRRILCEAIQLAGHEADCVSTAREAKERLSRVSYALMVFNTVLPDGSGHELVSLAAERGIKTVVISEHPDELQAMYVAGTAYLRKPFRLEEFAQLLERTLGA